MLAEEFSAGDLKILSEVRQPGGICYYHLCFTDGKLNAKKIKNLTENKGTCQRSVKKGRTADSILFQSAVATSDLSQTSRPCPSAIILYLQAKCPRILSLETITQKAWERGQNRVKLLNPAMIGKKKNQKTTKQNHQNKPGKSRAVWKLL